jgi:DNA (cytosine-5)-methyltransferase 1
MTLRLLDTFSGIGGFSLAARWLGGFQTVQFVERDPYCQRILRKHWPTVPIHDDICTFNPEPGSADVVCGGFPCQDISSAGKQAGIKEGTRSGLFYELMRVVRLVEPRYIVLENVAAILGRGLDDVLGALAEAGLDAEWACIPAAAVGACHRRDRWWAVAYASDLFSDGGAAGHSRQYGPGAVSESGNGDCSVATDTISHRPQGTIRLRPHSAAWPQANLRRLDPDWGGHVSEPVLCRGDDGLSGRVDRLRALGNAVVPQVAAIPLARVLELHNGNLTTTP